MVETDTGRALRLAGTRRAGWVHRDLRNAQHPADDPLRWSWRVTEAPTGSDLATKAADDSPIRVYVIFGNPRFILSGSGRVLVYSFGNNEPDGYHRPSYSTGRIHVIKVDGASMRGLWRDHEVDPGADYRKIWNRNPPPITGIGLMQDTDQTGARAVAEVRHLTLGGGKLSN